MSGRLRITVPFSDQRDGADAVEKLTATIEMRWVRNSAPDVDSQIRAEAYELLADLTMKLAEMTRDEP